MKLYKEWHGGCAFHVVTESKGARHTDGCVITCCRSCLHALQVGIDHDSQMNVQTGTNGTAGGIQSVLCLQGNTPTSKSSGRKSLDMGSRAISHAPSSFASLSPVHQLSPLSRKAESEESSVVSAGANQLPRPSSHASQQAAIPKDDTAAPETSTVSPQIASQTTASKSIKGIGSLSVKIPASPTAHADALKQSASPATSHQQCSSNDSFYISCCISCCISLCTCCCLGP